MDTNPIEWPRAQELLLKLVQNLVPLTDRQTAPSVFLSRRFFIPSANETHSLLRYSVQLLTTLHAVQKQVEKWVGEVEKAPEESALPVAKQAQKLIDQVQDAIGNLVTSSNIKAPKEETLRETLKRLKPNIDRVVEALAHEEEMHAADHFPPPFRFSVPRSPREHLLKKLVATVESIQPQRQVIKKPEKSQPQEEILEEKAESQTSRKENRSEVPDEKGIPFHAAKETHHFAEERTTLPGAPFFSGMKDLISARKKKKRKGFWFRDEGQDRDTP